MQADLLQAGAWVLEYRVGRCNATGYGTATGCSARSGRVLDRKQHANSARQRSRITRAMHEVVNLPVALAGELLSIL